MKLKVRLSLVFGAVVFLIVSIIGVVTFNKNAQMGTSDAKKTMQISAELAAREIEEKLDDFMKMAQVAGYDSALSSTKEASAVSEHIDSLAKLYGFTSGNILDSDGISRKDGTDFGDRDYVKEALSGNINISDLTLSKYTGNYGFRIASPTYNDTGRIDGVVYFRMDVDFMSNILNQIAISDNSYTYLVDGSGMANYDLTQEAMHSYPGDFNQLSDSVNQIRIIMQRLIKEVQASAYSVGTGSGELAGAAEALASATVTQASSINQLVSNVEDMSECIVRNSENEEQVQERLQKLEDLIISGNDQMQQLSNIHPKITQLHR